MYRGYLYRKKETQARAGHQLQANTPNGPASQASSSPTASLSTSPLPSVAHATSPSISSQADTPSADHSVSIPAPSTSPKNRFLPVSIALGPRPTTPAPMGQTNSSIDPLPHSPVFQSFPLAEPASPPPSNPLKRIWGNRRKKSEDVTAVFAASHDSSPSKGKARAHDVSASSSVLSTPAASVDDLQISPKKLPQVPKALKPGGPPPIPPPKNDEQQVRKEPSRSRLRVEAVLPSTIAAPNASASVPQLAQSQGSSLSPGLRDKTDAELKQDWRKSDSTVMSYVTIRPGALTSGRSTRPVSLAESSHSGHTVVPVNKRFSALITDAEFAMLEERDSDSEEDVIPITFNAHSSPTSSVKARNRRSASLNFGPGYPLKAFEAPALSGSVSAMPRLSRTLTDTPVLRDVPPTAPATTVTPPTGTKQWTVTTPAQSAKVSSRSQLAAWSTPTSDRAAPVQQQTRRPTAPNQIRQPKVSISGGGFAPVAFGFGRRAAEKVQRVWEGLSSSSAQSTHSASSSSISDSNRSATRQSLYGLQSSLPGAWKHQRRTPNGPSGSWSISSSIASAESDSFATPTGPTLGPRLRGPKRNAAGTAVIGGMVFGRELRKCVKETAIDDVRAKLDDNEGPIEMGDLEYVRPIEQRLLPAIVVRCYQHLQRWGLQEEGLFRINGRASHVAKLRSDFDTGADYELAKSDPGDLDPHAVSSIFKAYLRELPESLLTDALMPMFESSLPKNDNTAQSVAPRLGLGLRKPPSLSTLAMPSFAVQRTVSNETTRAISSLIAQLPIENRDLLYTVVELINATAAASKETKMPLGNLLLLFCPSLGVSHALLRMLCEAKDIWTPPAKDDTQAAPLPEVTSMSRTPSGCPIVNGYPSSFSTTDSESDLSSLPAARPRNGRRRGPIATMVESPGLSMYRSSSGSAQDDAASYMSALDGSPSDSNNSITNLPALSTSTDSLATPSTMSEVSSLQQSAAPYHASEPNKDAPSTVSSDEHDVDLSLPEPRRRPLISPPVPFPSSGEGSPRTPLSPRKSLALLSFPPLNKSDANTPGSSATWAHRPKRPSLTLLFSKKSMSSLKSSPSQPRKDSCSTPVEPVCIRPTTPAVPPVLDTTISSSPIHLFDFAETKLAEPVKPEAPTGDRLSAKDSDWQGRERNDSSPGSSLFSTPHSTPQQTPIADYFRARSKSVLSLNDEKDAKTPAEASNVYPARPSPLASSSQLSLTPSLDVGIASALEEDWAQSVLDEAQASSSAKSRWRVSKLF